jgi:hypothetical protein
MRQVDQTPGCQVGESIPRSYDKEHRRNWGWIEADDVRVVDEQEQSLQREGQVVRKIARGVAEVVAHSQLLHRSSYEAVAWVALAALA